MSRWNNRLPIWKLQIRAQEDGVGRFYFKYYGVASKFIDRQGYQCRSLAYFQKNINNCSTGPCLNRRIRVKSLYPLPVIYKWQNTTPWSVNNINASNEIHISCGWMARTDSQFELLHSAQRREGREISWEGPCIPFRLFREWQFSRSCRDNNPGSSGMVLE